MSQLPFEQFKELVPDYLKSEIERIALKYQKNPDELYRMMWQKYLRVVDKFPSEEDKINYVFTVVKAKFIASAKLPTKPFKVIVLGYTPVRLSKKTGVPMSTIYVLAKSPEEKKWRKMKIICKDKHAELYKSVMLFSMYDNVKLFEGNNVLIATDETNFTDPKPLPTNPVELLKKVVGAEEITVREARKKTSKLQPDGNFIDDWDIKIVKGVVITCKKKVRPDGTEYGVCVVTDRTAPTEDEVDDEGYIIPSSILVIAAPDMIENLVTDSWAVFYGPLRYIENPVEETAEGEIEISAKSGRVIMNAIGVHPLYIPIEG